MNKLRSRLKPYQVEGVDYLLSHRFAALADDVGCISGDSIIKVNRVGNSKPFTLRHLHYKFHGGASLKGRKWDSTVPCKTSSMYPNMDLRLNTIKDVVFKGYKPVMLLKVKGEKSYELKATPDHVVFTPEGEKPIESLKVGDSVYVNGLKYCEVCKDFTPVVGKYNKFEGACRICAVKIYRQAKTSGSRKVDKDGYIIVSGFLFHKTSKKNFETRGAYYFLREHILVMEAKLNNMPYEEYLDALKYNKNVEEFFYIDTKTHAVHHINGIKDDNRIENLEYLTIREHCLKHQDVNKIPGMRAHLGVVTGIEMLPEVEDVYDLVMESDPRNFVADGVVVHNCGKSLTSLTAAVESQGRTLVVCPAYLRINWKNEILKWIPDAPIELFSKAKNIYYPFDADFVIIGYDQLKNATELFKWATVLIVDEAHFCFNAEAKRTEMLHELVDLYRPKYLFLLSGTPIKNRVVEFYSLLVLLSQCPYNSNGANVGRLFPYFEDFANKFSEKKIRRVTFERYGRTLVKKVPQYYGLKNEAELKEILKGKYLRRTAGKYLDVAKPIFKPVFLSDKADEALLADFELAMDSENSAGLNSANKKNSAIFKIPMTIEYVKGLLEEVDQVLVYSDHVIPVEEIAKAFEVEPITGKVPTEKRQQIADKWRRKETRVLVATIESFSTGINLTETNHLVFNDESWVPASNLQAIGRINRIGQTKTPVIHQLYFSPQDYKIQELLKEKQIVLNAVLS